MSAIRCLDLTGSFSGIDLTLTTYRRQRDKSGMAICMGLGGLRSTLYGYDLRETMRMRACAGAPRIRMGTRA